MTETPATPPTSLLTKAQAATGAARKREGGEAFVFGIRDEVAELLAGSPFNVDSYLQNAYRVIAASRDLVAASSQAGETVLGGVMLGATLHLPIGGPLGQFYLTPRREGRGDNQRKVCVPMIGYRGFFELGFRSGRVAKYDYRIVRDGDTFDEWADSEGGNRFMWRGMPDGDDDRPLTHVVAIAKMLSGEVSFQAMSRHKIDGRKPSYTTNTPWEGKHAEAMYVKTPHRELAKFQQLTIGQALAVDADENITNWNRATQALETQHGEHAIEASAGIVDEQAAGEPPADEQPPAQESDWEEPPTPQAGAEGRDAAEPSPEEWARIEAERMAREP